MVDKTFAPGDRVITPDGPGIVTEEPFLMSSGWTVPVKLDDPTVSASGEIRYGIDDISTETPAGGTRTIRVQRACNGCGSELRDVNKAELDAAMCGRPLPDVTGECPTCTPPAPLCADPCPHGHDHTCARSPKHCGPHRDVKQKGDESCSWLVAEPDVVHVATPEGVTPCGEGHHDVQVDALISAATCLECLRTLAWAAHGPTVTEDAIADRVAQLERDMGRVEHDRAEDSSRLALLGDRMRSAESELGPVVWSDAAAPGGYVCAAPIPEGLCGVPVESEPCREHSLAGRLAEAGPDGTCRHTPATRLR
ncbi:hypothetical protein [Nocardiopsis dassonvillei]|uniref:hypothetical protein n=1 Tax=Nocardiopsis dassonvillei TaxID=2014 RepID=UPI00363BE251